MKIAFYSEDGLDQIVLTPETATERAMLDKVHDGDPDLSVKRGSFYHCQGGWTRQSAADDSTMIVLRKRATP